MALAIALALMAPITVAIFGSLVDSHFDSGGFLGGVLGTLAAFGAAFYVVSAEQRRHDEVDRQNSLRSVVLLRSGFVRVAEKAKHFACNCLDYRIDQASGKDVSVDRQDEIAKRMLAALSELTPRIMWDEPIYSMAPSAADAVVQARYQIAYRLDAVAKSVAEPIPRSPVEMVQYLYYRTLLGLSGAAIEILGQAVEAVAAMDQSIRSLDSSRPGQGTVSMLASLAEIRAIEAELNEEAPTQEVFEALRARLKGVWSGT